ncbi:hypothetical protein ACWCQN_36020 [Streptomyces sp. NPDC001984]
MEEDEQADGDQHERQQDVAPAAERLGDDRTGGEEPAREAPHRDQDQEDYGIHAHPARCTRRWK